VTKRAQTLGLLYAYINGVSLFIKIAALPLLFMILNNIQVQRLVPVTYLGMVLLGMGHPSFFVAAFSFAFMKCSDYSIFSVSKELFYYGLTAEQKFGMKYVGDMFGYRLGKALISAFLIFVQDEKTLGFVLVGLLLVWCGLFFVTPKLKTSASGTTL
jgi:ATP/ADP translocase